MDPLSLIAYAAVGTAIGAGYTAVDSSIQRRRMARQQEKQLKMQQKQFNTQNVNESGRSLLAGRGVRQRQRNAGNPILPLGY